MKLIIGLGNPGSKYQNTRHNIGFLILDRSIKGLSGTFKFDPKFNAEIFFHMHQGQKIAFMKPTTYMNLSGEAISRFMKYYDISIEEILVFVDDINLPSGKLRLRELGGHGGHNGLRNIIGLLKDEAFKRVRIGIDNNPSMPLDAYVLGKFQENEVPMIERAIDISVKIIDDFMNDLPFKDIMTKYNTQT